MIRRILALVATVLVVYPALAHAQAAGTGSVIGKVADSSGAVLPGVTVTLKSPEALGSFSGVTDAQGAYRVNNLPPATYEAKAELQGFQAAVQTVTVRLSSTVTADFALPVGSVAEV